MSEFGPGFEGGNPALISPDIFAPEERSVIIEVPIWHSGSTEETLSHMQLEIAQGADVSFIVPLFQGDTLSNRVGWHYKPEMFNTEQVMSDFPSLGVKTFKSLTPASGRAATGIYILTGADANVLVPNHTYLARSRQTQDRGHTWGKWNITILRP